MTISVIAVTPFYDSVTSHMIFPVLHLSNNLKEKKRKRNINNDLAILPSHDKKLMSFTLKWMSVDFSHWMT